jgi:aldose 1-epimerase
MPRIAPLSGRQYPIAAGDHSAVISEVGAALRGYSVGGTEVTCSWPDDELPPKGCGSMLVPWPNRIRDGRYSFDGVDYQLGLTDPSTGNAIHGFGRWSRWSRVRQDVSSVTLRLDVVPQTGYPFQVRAEATFALDPEYGLTVTLSAQNVGRTRAPFGAGSHPYLSTRGSALDDVRLQVPAREMLVMDEAQVPVGTRSVSRSPHDLRRGKRLKDLRLDDGFTGLARDEHGRGFASVLTSAGGAQLWFDETFGYLQVFTRENLTPGRHGIAIEPMTCAPDAFNSGAGLIVLEPGGEWAGSWGIAPLP